MNRWEEHCARSRGISERIRRELERQTVRCRICADDPAQHDGMCAPCRQMVADLR